MYDTINFKLSSRDAKGVDFLEEVPCYLDNVSLHNYAERAVMTGWLDGLKVTVSQDAVRVRDGSFSRWYYGDNSQRFRRGDVERAVGKLSDCLHLPMSRATITRLDVAVNIITKYSPGVYFAHLGYMNNAERLEQPNGLYYKKANQTVCFYDKLQELKTRGERIPEVYDGKNVLRYEQRYLQRLSKQFKVCSVTGATLYDEAFYINLWKKFFETYEAIGKTGKASPNFKLIKTKKQLHLYGVLLVVKHFGGAMKLLKAISEAQKTGRLTSKQAYDLRQEIQRACSMGNSLTVESEAVKELNRKMKEAKRYFP